MLDRTLPPPELPQGAGLAEQSQAFALCYLASYGGTTPSQRVLDSFGRSYGISQFLFFPRVVNTRPAFVVSRTEYNWGNHVVIAFEGMTSSIQLWQNFSNPTDAEAINNPGGHTYAPFKILRDACETLMAGNATLLAWLVAPGSVVTFAGYSLGAAVADLIAARFQADNPARVVRLRKFSSPRVATVQYFNARSPRLMVSSMLNEGDQIYTLPLASFATLGQTATTLMFLNGYALDPSTITIDYRGNAVAGRPWFNPARGLSFIANYVAGSPTNAQILPHRMDSYRHLLCCLCDNVPEPMTRYRFRYLEFPDDNAWQNNWRYQPAFDPTWKALLDPAPDPQTTRLPEDEIRLHAMPNQPALPPATEVNIGPGVETWDVPNPLAISGRRRLSQRPPDQQ